MQVNKISLAVRLQRLSKAYPSDPAFVVSTIYSLMNIPIVSFLRDFPIEVNELRLMIEKDSSEIEEMTFFDVAQEVARLWRMPEERLYAETALDILTLPFERYDKVMGGKYV